MYTGHYVGHLLHPNVEKDACELAKPKVRDWDPWPPGTTVRREAMGSQYVTVNIPGVYSTTIHESRYDPNRRDFEVFVEVHPVTGEVFARRNIWERKPASRVYCGRLEKRLTYYPRTWAEADIFVSCNEMYSRCLWYVVDVLEHLQDVKRSLIIEAEERARAPENTRNYECPFSGNVLEVPEQITHDLFRASTADRVEKAILDRIEEWLNDQPWVRNNGPAPSNSSLLNWAVEMLERKRKNQWVQQPR